MNRQQRSRAGFSMGVVLLCLVLLATLALASAGMGAISLRQITTTARSGLMVHVADGALNDLMDRIYNNESYTEAGTVPSVTSVGAVNTRWTFDSNSTGPYCTNNLRGTAPVTGWGGYVVPAGTAFLVVTAGRGDTTEAGVAAIVANNYPYTVACDGELNVGDVSAGTSPDESNLRSNLTGGDPNVDAGVVEGQVFSCDGPGSIDVSGDAVENYYEPPIALPDIPILAIIDSFSPGGTNGQHKYGGPAAHSFNQTVTASTDKDGFVYINNTKIGPLSSVYVKGNLTFSGDTNLAMGVHFFVKGNIKFNGALNQIGAPENGNPSAPGHRVSPLLNDDNTWMLAGGTISLNGGSANRISFLAANGIQQNGGSTWNGLVYTENGDIGMTGTSVLTGMVIARGGDLTAKGVDITSDPNVIRELAALNFNVYGFVRARTWFRL